MIYFFDSNSVWDLVSGRFGAGVFAPPVWRRCGMIIRPDWWSVHKVLWLVFVTNYIT